MRLITKCICVCGMVGLLAAGTNYFSGRGNDLESAMKAPKKETNEYRSIIEKYQLKSNLTPWPGVFRAGIEAGGKLLEYKIYFSPDHKFVMTLASFTNKEKWTKLDPESFGKLSGNYRVKGQVVYFEALTGSVGLMSDQARSAIELWTPNQVDFKSENNTLRFAKIGDKPASEVEKVK